MEGQEEAIVEMTLQELAHEIHENVGVRMHRLGVCEWEVKLWMPSIGLASGAWRVVVTNVTGHTCTIHVSFITIQDLFITMYIMIARKKIRLAT